MSPPSGGTRELVLTNLFGLHGGRVLSAEAELSDGHIVQDDVEVFGPLEQLSADQQRHLQAKEGRIFTVCWGCRDSLIWIGGKRLQCDCISRFSERRIRQLAKCVYSSVQCSPRLR